MLMATDFFPRSTRINHKNRLCRVGGYETGCLGDTNVHVITRVDGSGTERRLKEFLRSSEFVARTGFLADNAHFCRTRRGMHGEGTVFRHLNLTHFSDDHVECLTDINTQTQGSAVLFLIPTLYANGRAVQPCRTPPHGIVTISDLGR